MPRIIGALLVLKYLYFDNTFTIRLYHFSVRCCSFDGMFPMAYGTYCMFSVSRIQDWLYGCDGLDLAANIKNLQ